MPIKTKKRANQSHRKRSRSWTGGVVHGMHYREDNLDQKRRCGEHEHIGDNGDGAHGFGSRFCAARTVPVASASASVRVANAAAWSIPAVVTVTPSPSNTATMSHSASDAPSSIQLWTPKSSSVLDAAAEFDCRLHDQTGNATPPHT